MANLVWVAVGGALGSVARYLMAVAVQSACPAFKPAGTMAVNVLGCLVIGAAMNWIVKHNAVGSPVHLWLVTGVLGGFTTFSAFGYETVGLLQEKQVALALWNVTGNLVLGLPAVFLGHLLVDWTSR